MDILKMIDEDVANLDVKSDVELFIEVFGEYLNKLVNTMYSKSNADFDFKGGVVSSFKYLQFDNGVLTTIDNGVLTTIDDGKTQTRFTVYIKDFVMVSFQYHFAANEFTYWSHHVKSSGAKEVLMIHTNRIKDLIKSF